MAAAIETSSLERWLVENNLALAKTMEGSAAKAKRVLQNGNYMAAH